LRPRWSLQATVVFWALLGLQLLLLGFFGPQWHWLWLGLLSLPLFAWLLRRDQRRLQSMFVVFLDELAKDCKMTKVRQSSARLPPSVDKVAETV
jgi:hypothetical protein